MDLFSCDTMVALGNSTKSGNVIFAKNSDRPITEPQPLVSFEARDYDKDEKVQCTYISIPQVSHTYKVMGSKPFWIWGFEHGMNEHKVVIGNEAVWAREPVKEEKSLLGMDLLRLGLERGKTAYEALHVITDLLEQYGQGGNAAIGMEHYYHNSFLIADPNEAWVLDTCNRRWVARKVKDVQGISNCYSTEEYWDEECGDIKEYAYKNGWISRDVKFNFAKAYSAMTPKHRAAYPRYARLNKLLNQNKGQIDINTMRMIQRDHYEGELIQPRWSPADGLMVSICMHGMFEGSSKTAAASHVEITKDKELTWWNCFSVPCISIFTPFAINKNIPENVSKAEAKYSDDSLWWKFERLQYAIEEDYEYNMEKWNPIKTSLENDILQKTLNLEELSNKFIQDSVDKIEKAVDKMYEEIIANKRPSENPQHFEFNEVCKKRAGIQ